LWQEVVQSLTRRQDMLDSPALERIKPQLRVQAREIARQLDEAHIALAKPAQEKAGNKRP
jgi:hypothetical protein